MEETSKIRGFQDASKPWKCGSSYAGEKRRCRGIKLGRWALAAVSGGAAVAGCCGPAFAAASNVRSVMMTDRDALHFSPLRGYLGPPSSIHFENGGRVHLYFELAVPGLITASSTSSTSLTRFSANVDSTPATHTICRVWDHVASDDGGVTWVFLPPVLPDQSHPSSGIAPGVFASFSAGSAVRMPDAFPYRFMFLVARADCKSNNIFDDSCSSAVRNRYSADLIHPAYSIITGILFAIPKHSSPTSFQINGYSFFSVLREAAVSARVYFYYLAVRGESVMALESSDFTVPGLGVENRIIRHQIVEIGEDGESDWFLIFSARNMRERRVNTYYLRLTVQPTIDIHPIEHPGIVVTAAPGAALTVFDGGLDAQNFVIARQPSSGDALAVGWGADFFTPSFDQQESHNNVFTVLRRVINVNGTLLQEPLPVIISKRKCKQTGSAMSAPKCDYPEKAQLADDSVDPDDNEAEKENGESESTGSPTDGPKVTAEGEMITASPYGMWNDAPSNFSSISSFSPVSSFSSFPQSERPAKRRLAAGAAAPVASADFPVTLSPEPCSYEERWAVSNSSGTVAHLIDVRFSSTSGFTSGSGLSLHLRNAADEWFGVSLNAAGAADLAAMAWAVDRSGTALQVLNQRNVSSLPRGTADAVSGQLALLVDRTYVEVFAEFGRFMLGTRYFVENGPFDRLCIQSTVGPVAGAGASDGSSKQENAAPSQRKAMKILKTTLNRGAAEVAADGAAAAADDQPLLETSDEVALLDVTRTAVGTMWANEPYFYEIGAGAGASVTAVTLAVVIVLIALL